MQPSFIHFFLVNGHNVYNSHFKILEKKKKTKWSIQQHYIVNNFVKTVKSYSEVNISLYQQVLVTHIYFNCLL